MTTTDPVLQALTSYCERHFENMKDWRDQYGYTCDERGCAICNADSATDAATSWLEAWQRGGADLPFDSEEEMKITIEGTAGEWLEFSGDGEGGLNLRAADGHWHVPKEQKSHLLNILEGMQ